MRIDPNLLKTLWMLAIVSVGSTLCASHKKNNIHMSPSPVQREDSRQYMSGYEEHRVPSRSKGYRKSSRAPKSPEPQVIDMPVHLRSCSVCNNCCKQREQVEGVPDLPWYVRWFSCCRGRR